MKSLVKLFTLVLTLVFLVGCGGDGGGEGYSDNREVTLEMIDSSFPVLNVNAFTVESSVEYSPVSKSKINNFRDNLVSDKGFSCIPDGTQCAKSNVITGVTSNATAYLYDTSIYLDIITTGNLAHNSTLYQEIFGSIDANIVYVYVEKSYAQNNHATHQYYVNTLREAQHGFECYLSTVSSDWVCDKIVDRVGYFWETSNGEYKAMWGIRLR
ncbi:MAG: hypothetical protein LBI78_01680 [Campylobacteraceae bacterium]|jgi:hypothetical protein|nr:hypothetical protein [Campylobacteraceae bacterium]